MKTFLKILGALILVIVLLSAGVYVWASSAAGRILAETHEAHTVDFPIPFPVSEGNMVNEGLALEQAVERGRHLVTARYACTECHGANLAGGVMIDAFPLGTLLGPNLTGGEGSRTRGYTPADWDRTVRHGILPDGRASVMPSEDFRLMSDQELSDIIAFIQAHPAVDNTVPAPTFGPLGKILLATGKIVPSAKLIGEHHNPHLTFPPEAQVTAEFGAHLAATCTGCHGLNFAGGPIAGGDPSWPPARNLTPHATGLASWSYEDFVKAIREGIRPDGTPLKAPMTLVAPYAQNMTPVELEAIWVYLESLPPVDNVIP
jgi:mono/diheme cytochrome c family protein